MPLPALSIKKPVGIAMFYIGVAILAAGIFESLGVDLLPDIKNPYFLVYTNCATLSAQEIETQITAELEAALSSLQGVKKIRSVSQDGACVIRVDFFWGTNMDEVFLEAREKLDNARSFLPREANRPTILKMDPSSLPLMSIAVFYKNKDIFSSPYVNKNSNPAEIEKLIDLKNFSESIVKRRIEQIEGAAQAIVLGGLKKEIEIIVDLDKAYNYNVSYLDLSNSIKKYNANFSVGAALKDNLKYPLRIYGEFSSISEIENLTIKVFDNNRELKIKDIAQVRVAFEERSGFARVNGVEIVNILIIKSPGANSIKLSREINKVLDEFRADYPDLDFKVLSDQSFFIDQAIQNVNQEIYFGGALAVLVLLFFLGSIRNIFLIGIAIPTSLSLTVIAMFFFDISFNVISLGGIALGIGMLMDNAIVAIENIAKYREKGYDQKKAALYGTNEVSLPIVASTITTVVVFLPLVFMKGIAAELFKDQSFSISISLAASILVALTLIPMLASRENSLKKFLYMRDSAYFKIDVPDDKNLYVRLLKLFLLPIKILSLSFKFLTIKVLAFFFKLIENYFSKFYAISNKRIEILIEKYDKALEYFLRNKKIAIIFLAFFFAFSAFIFFDIKKEFIPEGPVDQFSVEARLPAGFSLDMTSQIALSIEKEILKIPDVVFVYSSLGKPNEMDLINKDLQDENYFSLTIKINDDNNYYKTKDEIKKIFARREILDFSFKEIETAYGSVIKPSRFDIEIKIQEKDLAKARYYGERIVEIVKKEINSDLKISEVAFGTKSFAPEIFFNIDKEKCLLYDIDYDYLIGFLKFCARKYEAGYFPEFDRKTPINLKTKFSNDCDIANFLDIKIKTPQTLVPMKELVNAKVIESPKEIRRENQNRVFYLYANLAPGASLEKEISKIRRLIANDRELNGINYSIGGANEEIKIAFQAIYFSLLISILLMYMTLAAEFESFIFPFIVMLIVPMGLLGGIATLYFTGQSLNVISFVGLVVLLGIADNDAVLKVDTIIRNREKGMKLEEAIFAAGKNRFRPIVMNTLTVVFGLIPAALFGGAASQLRIPMALALIGGLLFSTILSLFLIPVLYVYLEKFSNKDFVKDENRP